MKITLKLLTMFRFYLNLSANILGLSALLFLFGQQTARAQAPGSLDSSFGNGGKVITPVGLPLSLSLNRRAGASATAVQSDGKIVVAGTVETPTAYLVQGGSDFALVRYNTDGSLDTSFDGDGIVITDFRTDFSTFGNSSDGAYAIAIQPDGKIVAAGYSSVGAIIAPPAGNSNFALARYNTDGSLDTSFDGDGKVLTHFGATE
jgi:uncharacterized delta-60 repeat protein